ncbi:alpha/beta fold hydrolase [Saccharopolyspora flava]|uniref:Pimeloyl-ACP methyl ester carboxylesterase n=1 Tax=Saccharopolyspora flava TaxID=95161 RepID=A0A1I6PF83_9PSEU|nr:alpha/beta hydrolase [Saccharopolyspora flava]SFS38874.1 Pimeloyl-ACP methyl ester carboxylesterase [Saccharopolyspora flava]
MTAPPQGVEVDQIEFPAGKVRYYKAGTDGPPIVLLHGGGPDNALLSWRHTIGALAPDHRVYAPDLPGQGGSTEWRGRGNQRTFEEVLRWLLDAWQVPQAILVGLSMGGSIAAGFTLRHPQRVRALALVDSTGVQHRMPHHLLTYLLMRTDLSGRVAAKLLRGNRALVRTALDKVFFADPSSVRDLDAVVEEIGAEARARRSVFADWHADAINRRSMSINHLPQLDRITCPVTVIHGEKDALVPVASAQAVAGAIPGAQLRIMQQAGHWPNRERPTEFNALLREFVNALDTPAPPASATSGPAALGPATAGPQRDASAEAPTQRMKAPSGSQDTAEAETQMLKIGTGSTPASEDDADAAKPDEDTTGKPATDSGSTETADEASGDTKATADAPTRFIKVDSPSKDEDDAPAPADEPQEPDTAEEPETAEHAEVEEDVKAEEDTATEATEDAEEAEAPRKPEPAPEPETTKAAAEPKPEAEPADSDTSRTEPANDTDDATTDTDSASTDAKATPADDETEKPEAAEKATDKPKKTESEGTDGKPVS